MLYPDSVMRSNKEFIISNDNTSEIVAKWKIYILDQNSGWIIFCSWIVNINWDKLEISRESRISATIDSVSSGTKKSLDCWAWLTWWVIPIGKQKDKSIVKINKDLEIDLTNQSVYYNWNLMEVWSFTNLWPYKVQIRDNINEYIVRYWTQIMFIWQKYIRIWHVNMLNWKNNYFFVTWKMKFWVNK